MDFLNSVSQTLPYPDWGGYHGLTDYVTNDGNHYIANQDGYIVATFNEHSVEKIVDVHEKKWFIPGSKAETIENVKKEVKVPSVMTPNPPPPEKSAEISAKGKLVPDGNHPASEVAALNWLHGMLG